MGYEVEVTILSADGLNWRHHSGLKPCAVVWVDQRSSKYATGVDERGGTCPRWDHKLEIPINAPVDDSCLHIDVVHVESDEGTNQHVLVGSARLPLRDVDLGEPAVNKKLELTLRPSGSPHGNVDVKVAVRETRGYHAPDPYYGREHKSNIGWKPKRCVQAGGAILRTLFGKIKLGTGERVATDDSLEDWVCVENSFPPETGTNQLVLVGSAQLSLRDVDLGEPAINKKLELTLHPSGSPHGNADVKVAVRETRGYHAPDPYYGRLHKSNIGWMRKGCVPAGGAILRTLFGKIKLGTGERVAANDSLEDWVCVENPSPPERVVHVDKIHKKEAVQRQSDARETRLAANYYGEPSTTVNYDDLEDIR